MSGSAPKLRRKKTKKDYQRHSEGTLSLHGQLCRGKLFGNGVVVTSEGDIKLLINNGCFGKGALSRTVPTSVLSEGKELQPWKNEPPEQSISDSQAVAHEAVPTDVESDGEHLQLGSAEAFYLVHTVRCLQVRNHADMDCDAKHLWQYFNKLDERFIAKYVAYCYYRARSWVPKSGLKFGVDFLLYKEGPPTYHSSYGVAVTQRGQRALTWQEVVSLCRVNEAACKDLIVCQVLQKADSSLTEEGLDDPSCLEHLAVHDTVVQRWNPDRERT